MRHVFLLGSNGIPSSYGGFETFVDRLTEGSSNIEIKYHVSCMSNSKDNEFIYNNAHCFNIKVPSIGASRALYYDAASLRYCCNYIKENKIERPIVYMLGTGIGPFILKYVKKLHDLGALLFVNPDGLEWKRNKWHPMVRKYLKISERIMVKNSDLVVCDSVNIENYIKEEYKKYKPKTTFIAYGADYSNSKLTYMDEKVQQWYKRNDIKPLNYYLIVGRFVPENNYEVIIREFMKSKTKKNLVIITNVEQNKFYNDLKEKTGFDKDRRIKFVGVVYDQDFLKYIRENAFAYLHGHEVGGTNPSLLESLASTRLNLLLDVGFNKEVADNAGLYWNKREGNLSNLINSVDETSDIELDNYGALAKKRITDCYNWANIINQYESLFVGSI